MRTSQVLRAHRVITTDDDNSDKLTTAQAATTGSGPAVACRYDPTSIIFPQATSEMLGSPSLKRGPYRGTHATAGVHHAFRWHGSDVAACRAGAEYQQSSQTDRLLARSLSGNARSLAGRHARPRLDRGAGLRRHAVRDRGGKPRPLR